MNAISTVGMSKFGQECEPYPLSFQVAQVDKACLYIKERC